MEPAWEKISGSKFRLASYNDAQGKPRPCYELTKRECLYVATKFNDEAIRKMEPAWEKIAHLKFKEGTYKDSNGQDRPCYELTKRECEGKILPSQPFP